MSLHERECCGLLRGFELSLSESDEELEEEEDVADEEDEDEIEEDEEEKLDEDDDEDVVIDVLEVDKLWWFCLWQLW